MEQIHYYTSQLVVTKIAAHGHSGIVSNYLRGVGGWECTNSLTFSCITTDSERIQKAHAFVPPSTGQLYQRLSLLIQKPGKLS